MIDTSQDNKRVTFRDQQEPPQNQAPQQPGEPIEVEGADEEDAVSVDQPKEFRPEQLADKQMCWRELDSLFEQRVR